MINFTNPELISILTAFDINKRTAEKSLNSKDAEIRKLAQNQIERFEAIINKIKNHFTI